MSRIERPDDGPEGRPGPAAAGSAEETVEDLRQAARDLRRRLVRLERRAGREARRHPGRWVGAALALAALGLGLGLASRRGA